MGYDFENSPLNSYLEQLRELQIEAAIAQSESFDSNNTYEVRKAAQKKSIRIFQEISELRKNNSLPPRDFDVFHSPAELAREKFLADNPEPYNPSQCHHPDIELRIRAFDDNSTHLVKQCLSCGKALGNAKKDNNPDWMSYPEFNSNIGSKERATYRNWITMRQQTITDALVEIDTTPDFNHAEFKAKYTESHPEPLSPSTCEHPDTHITIRRYGDHMPHAVVQCKICGKHVKGISKAGVNINETPEFDLLLEPKCNENHNKWFQTFIAAQKKASAAHAETVDRKVDTGEYQRVIRSKFNTYYDSDEWQNTRKRILQRDEHLCQSCFNEAECVHHITYERLGAENDFDLISLCNICHDTVHKIQDAYPVAFRLTPLEIRTLSD